MPDILILILGMTAVTYIPRLLPWIIRPTQKAPSWLIRFLKSIPYAALGALLLPGSLYAIEGEVVISALGIGLTALIALKVKNIALIVLIVVTAVTLALMIL